jgi:hypothetical protein
MAQSFAQLEGLITRMFGSIERAPAEIQAAFSQAQQQLHAVNTEVGRANDALKDNQANVQAAAGHWSGLGNAIEGMGGKAGAFVGKWGLVTAALGEGWAMGQKLNTLFGTDMSEWEEVVTRFGAKCGAIIKAASDMIVADVKLIAALFTGNVDEIKKAWKDFQTDFTAAGKTMSDTVTKWGTDWDRLHPSIKQTEERLKEATKATEEHAAAAKKDAEENAQLAQELEKATFWAGENTSGLQKSTQATGAHTAATQAHAAATKQATNKVVAFQDATGRLHVVTEEATHATNTATQATAAEHRRDESRNKRSRRLSR